LDLSFSFEIQIKGTNVKGYNCDTNNWLHLEYLLYFPLLFPKCGNKFVV